MPGSRVPPEVQLASQYGVSVITVRQALASLGEEGLISRHRGRGTFVTPDPHPHKELRLMGSVESVIAQQMSEETEVLEQSTAPVPPKLAPLFGADREVSFFRRLRRERGMPLSYALNYTLPEYGSQIDAKLLRRSPMLKILRDILGVKLSHVQISIGAQRATQEVAQPLDVDVFSPVLFFSGVVLDQRQRVVDVAWIYYRADRFTFTLDLDVSR
ncbi:MAG TPA: GntR family transcriptional regulator [Methylomirabilota bacterium]|nr:GntR family transcriptional regulator [Methylomirabilota bacterium]